MIKEAPPDATYELKPNLNIQDCSDLRSNPFQVGEDDVIMDDIQSGAEPDAELDTEEPDAAKLGAEPDAELKAEPDAELEPDKKHEAKGGLLASKRAKERKIKEGIGVTQIQEHQQMD